MVALGGLRFPMGEVAPANFKNPALISNLQPPKQEDYLAYKKTLPPRTLQYGYA